MDDQGEKIDLMAREILEAGVPDIAPKPKLKVAMTFKTLCLATTLAAAAGGVVSTVAQENTQPIGKHEKTEIRALIYYTSKTKGIDEDVLRREVEAKTGIDDLDELTAREFPAVRRYLQEKAQ